MITIIDLLTNEEKKKVKYVTLKSNEILFHEGEEAKYLGVLLSGALSIESYSLTGSLIVFNIILPGDLFANNLLFSNDSMFLGDVKAKTKSNIALISKDDLLNILSSNKAFLIQYLKKQSEFTKTLNSKVKILSLTHARERLLYYLNNKGGKIYVPSISELARNIGLSRESTSRTISELIKENKINRIGNSISVVIENNN